VRQNDVFSVSYFLIALLFVSAPFSPFFFIVKLLIFINGKFSSVRVHSTTLFTNQAK